MRKNLPAELAYDSHYQEDSPWWHRVIVRLFRKHINSVAHKVMARAAERSQIDSFTLHEMTGSLARMLYPERYRNQPLAVQPPRIERSTGDMLRRRGIIALAVGLVCLAGISLQAQTGIPGFDYLYTNAIVPITQASNHTLIVFGGEDITKREPLGGIGDIYNFSKNVGFFTDFQFEGPNTLSGVSGSLMLQVPFQPFGTNGPTISPNAYAGLMTHLAGYGTQNGTVDAVAGVGGSLQAWKWLYLFAEYETRQNSGTKALLGGAAIKLYAGDGTGAFGSRLKRHLAEVDAEGPRIYASGRY